MSQVEAQRYRRAKYSLLCRLVCVNCRRYASCYPFRVALSFERSCNRDIMVQVQGPDEFVFGLFELSCDLEVGVSFD